MVKGSLEVGLVGNKIIIGFGIDLYFRKLGFDLRVWE